MPISGAATDLGLGSLLGQQVQDETEEEKRKRLLGLSSTNKGSAAAQQLLGMMDFGRTGVQAINPATSAWRPR